MTAALAAQNETVNNYLSNKPANLAAKSEKQQYADANKACSAGDNAACQQARQLLQTSKDRDALLNAACADRASASCGDAIRTAQHNGNYVVFGSDGQLYVYDNAQPVLAAPERASNPFQDQTAQGVTDLAINLAMGEGFGAGLKGVGFVGNRLFGFSIEVGGGIGAAGSVTTEQGGLNLFKWGKETTVNPAGWREGDYMLYLPNQGSPAANWAQNSSRLREVMNEGKPIYDSYRNPITGAQFPTTGFLNAERNLLESRGWQYNSQTGAYYPPIR